MVTQSAIAPNQNAYQLIDSYDQQTSFFFRSPKRTMLAHGIFALDHCTADQRLPEHARKLLVQAHNDGHDMPLIIGALPFDSRQAAQLVVPMAFQLSGPLQITQDSYFYSAAPAAYELRSVPSAAEHMHHVEQALKLIEQGELRKIVLARTLELTTVLPIDVPLLLRNLAFANPHSYAFALNLYNGARPRTLLGATPELLISRSGLQIVSNPLAGSAPRGSDPHDDQHRARALLASPKDQREHALVVEAVAETLRPFCRTLHVPAPSLINTPTLWHLSTLITGELLDPAISSLELAQALHPTPAVCGTPTIAAQRAIQQIEGFDRGFYAGALGWCDTAGDGRWVVTIRCAEVEERTMRLFAGGGIVAHSQPEQELAETSTKLRTMLRALGIDHDGQAH